MERLIKIIDSGKPRYTLEPTHIILGKMYDHESEELVIERPKIEADSTCTLIVADISGKIVDNIDMSSNRYKIRNNLSQYSRVQLAFSFSKGDGYIKGSEIAYGDFGVTLKPTGFVPVEPEEKTNFNYLVGKAFVDVKRNDKNLDFYNLSNQVVASVEAGTGGGSDITKTSELENDGDGTSPFVTEAGLEGDLEIITQELADKASLGSPNEFSEAQTFNNTVTHNGEVVINTTPSMNSGVNVHNKPIKLFDAKKDIVTEITTEDIKIHNGTGEQAVTYTNTFPKDNGTLALTKQVDTKLDKAGGSITGNLAVQGNLSVKGEVTTEKQKTLEVENNFIYTNANKVELQSLLSGLAIYKDGTNIYAIAYDPASNSVKLGLGYRDEQGVFHFNDGEGSPIAIRVDSADLIDNHIMVWDATANKLKDSGSTISEITTELDKKLDKVTTYGDGRDRAYCATHTGESIMTDISSYNHKNTIVKRNDYGNFRIGTPAAKSGFLDYDENNAINVQYANLHLVSKEDYATKDTAGIVKVREDRYSGIMQNADHILFIQQAVDTQIDAKSDGYNPITSANLNYAVTSALTADNGISLTDNQKTSAQQKLGVKDALDGKLNRLAQGENNRVYVRTTNGEDTSLPFTYTAEADSIAKRSASGTLAVETPTQEDDATNKKYVDNQSQKYLSLTGESGTLDDNQYALVTGYDNLIIQRAGVDLKRCGHPVDNQGNYVFISPYYTQPNGTEEFVAYIITIKTDKTWTSTIKNFLQIGQQLEEEVDKLAQSYEQSDADNAIIIRNGNIVTQMVTFDVTGNAEKIWSFPYSYDAGKTPICWVNCVSEGNSASNGAAVISKSNTSMTIRVCGVNTEVSLFAQGWITQV